MMGGEGRLECEVECLEGSSMRLSWDLLGVNLMVRYVGVRYCHYLVMNVLKPLHFRIRKNFHDCCFYTITIS